MTRIVHVYKDYWPPVVGGIERCIHWMAEGMLARGGCEVTALVNSRSRRTRERDCNGVRVIEVGEWGRALSAPLSPGFPLWLGRLEADVWHFHIPNPTGDVSCLLARPRGAVVATWHSDIVRQRWAMGAYAPFLRAFLRRCRVVMPTSPRLIEASPFLRDVRDRCIPVPLGMPLEPFERTGAAGLRAREVRRRYGAGGFVVVFVGKLRYYKGLQFLLQALAQLPRIQALVIGEGPEGAALRRLAVELGVAERAHFLGELSDEEVVSHLHAADLFVLPSHLPSEAFGLSQVEAMAAGLPVVSTDLPTGVPYVNRDGESGLVVPPADAGALARAIGSLAADPALRNRLAEGAHRRAHAEFSRERMCEHLDAVYRTVLKGSPG